MCTLVYFHTCQRDKKCSTVTYRGVRFTFCFIDRSIDLSIDLPRFIYRFFDRLSNDCRSLDRFLKKGGALDFLHDSFGGGGRKFSWPCISVHQSAAFCSVYRPIASAQNTKNSRLLFRFASLRCTEESNSSCHSLLPQSIFPRICLQIPLIWT